MKKRIKTEIDLDFELESVKPVKLDISSKYENVKVKMEPSVDVSHFKFENLNVFDQKNSGHLAEFKGVFEQLDNFKKSLSLSVKKESSLDDLDFD